MPATVTSHRNGESPTAAPEAGHRAKPVSDRQSLTSQFATCKLGNLLLLKLVGFIEEERAEIMDVSDDHIVLRLGQPWYLRWWHGEERRRPISVRLDFADPTNDMPHWKKATARRSLVNVDIRPMTGSFRNSDFQRRADGVLRNLRLHFVAD